MNMENKLKKSPLPPAYALEIVRPSPSYNQTLSKVGLDAFKRELSPLLSLHYDRFNKKTTSYVRHSFPLYQTWSFRHAKKQRSLKEKKTGNIRYLKYLNKTYHHIYNKKLANPSCNRSKYAYVKGISCKNFRTSAY